MVRIYSLDKTWVLEYQPATDCRQEITPAMAISYSETENSVNTMSSIHTAADAHASTTECSTVKNHKRLHCTGYHLSPYVQFTKAKTKTANVTHFCISFSQSLHQFRINRRYHRRCLLKTGSA